VRPARGPPRPPAFRPARVHCSLDWVRYYSLARQGAPSVEAPQAEIGTYAGAC